MDQDALRELMSDSISDAINKVYTSWLEKNGFEASAETYELFNADNIIKRHMISIFEAAVLDIENTHEEKVKIYNLTKNMESLSTLTDQAYGSIEFWLEITSACLESGENYIDFARTYNLDPDELNLQALELLGESLSSEESSEKFQSIAFEVLICNADSGHNFEFELVLENNKAFNIDTLSGGKSESEWKDIFFCLFDNPDIGHTGKTGIYYKEAAEILTRIAFDKLGWGDATVQFYGIKSNGKPVKLTEGDQDIIHDYLGIQLNRDDYSMYFYG